MIRTVLLCGVCLLSGETDAAEMFVRPGHGLPVDCPVWGHKDGLQIGLAPAPGPRGLIRIYAPHVNQAYPRPINFISIETTAVGERRRDQSELAPSRQRIGQQGLTFWAADAARTTARPPDQLTPGELSDGDRRLRLFVHTEPFPNGTRPIVEVIFDASRPNEIELVAHAANDSVAIRECVLSATMGNYALLRTVRLKDKDVSASTLWPDRSSNRLTKDPLGFFAWKSWTTDDLRVDASGRVTVELRSNFASPAEAPYDDAVPRRWRYSGRPAVQYWRAERGTNAVFAVNARDTYWAVEKPIPGGPAIENFEMRRPFRDGQRLWFGVRPIARTENQQ